MEDFWVAGPASPDLSTVAIRRGSAEPSPTNYSHPDALSILISPPSAPVYVRCPSVMKPMSSRRYPGTTQSIAPVSTGRAPSQLRLIAAQEIGDGSVFRLVR